MLELYHGITSVCAQKVRIALAERQIEPVEHILTLRGDQNDPEFLKINPNGAVPVLVHDGRPIIESSLILYYLDEAYPESSLMPASPLQRYQIRMFNRLIDDYIHTACTMLTFATSLRPAFSKMPPTFWQSEGQQTPAKRRESEGKQSALRLGLESEYVRDALWQYKRLLSLMSDALKKQEYLGGNEFSNAECAVIPYLLRLEMLHMDGIFRGIPTVQDWWSRVRARPSVQDATLGRLSDQDWTPYRTLSPDPWPQVRAIWESL